MIVMFIYNSKHKPLFLCTQFSIQLKIEEILRALFYSNGGKEDKGKKEIREYKWVKSSLIIIGILTLYIYTVELLKLT